MMESANRFFAAALLAALAGSTVAQAPGITRTVVARSDISVPGSASGWHTHPGDEISVVNEGEAVLMIAGQPNRKVVAGEGFVIPAGVAHNAVNEGRTPTRLVGVYVVEKGKPLATPAP